MQQITLGRTGAIVSAISLGTWSYGGENTTGSIPVGWAGQTNDDSQKALLKCWEVGINHWDTADVYGDGRSEEVIGAVWDTVPRDEIFLATKVGWDQGYQNHWYDVYNATEHGAFFKKPANRVCRSYLSPSLQLRKKQ